jgi:hypothetical protein
VRIPPLLSIVWLAILAGGIVATVMTGSVLGWVIALGIVVATATWRHLRFDTQPDGVGEAETIWRARLWKLRRQSQAVP